MAYDIATPKTQEVLEKRRLRREDGPCALDSQNRRLYGLGVYRAWIADVDEFGDSVIGGADPFRGDHANPAALGSGLPVRAER
jgi:hypothetical protein